jgi:hypothetical protein
MKKRVGAIAIMAYSAPFTVAFANCFAKTIIATVPIAPTTKKTQ